MNTWQPMASRAAFSTHQAMHSHDSGSGTLGLSCWTTGVAYLASQSHQ
jgi:hypothetical protein